MGDIEKIKLLTGETNTDMITALLEDAKDFVLSYTNRTVMIPQLEKTVRDLAVVAYNRLGTEGETGRSEGKGSYTFDAAPKQIYDILNLHRLVRVGGKVHEFKTKSS